MEASDFQRKAISPSLLGRPTFPSRIRSYLPRAFPSASLYFGHRNMGEESEEERRTEQVVTLINGYGR